MSAELRHMARAGKTFFFASLWLPRDVRNDAAIAYSFCRAVDDIADEPSGGGSARLVELEAAIARRDPDERLIVGILSLIERYPSIEAPIVELVRACASDGPGIVIATGDDLLRYSEGVAGTVGRLMYPLLGGEDPAGEPHAEALGVAMQCTNIARDVFADHRDGRTYLPREWLGGDGLGGLVEGDPTAERRVVVAVERLLEFAAERYTAGLEGLSYLRHDCRRGIEIAARCYAEIGARVVVRGGLSRERAVVPLLRKVQTVLRVYLNPTSPVRHQLALTK